MSAGTTVAIILVVLFVLLVLYAMYISVQVIKEKENVIVERFGEFKAVVRGTPSPSLAVPCAGSDAADTLESGSHACPSRPATRVRHQLTPGVHFIIPFVERAKTYSWRYLLSQNGTTHRVHVTGRTRVPTKNEVMDFPKQCVRASPNPRAQAVLSTGAGAYDEGLELTPAGVRCCAGYGARRAVITRDNAMIYLDAVLSYKIINAKEMIYNTQNLPHMLSKLLQAQV